MEERRIFVEIDYCQFTWIIFTPYLYPLNPKFKKLLVGRIKAVAHKFCNHRGERTRKFIDGKRRLPDHHCFMTSLWKLCLQIPKLNSNVTWFLKIICVDCDNGSRYVSLFSRNLRLLVEESRLFGYKNFNLISTRWKFIKSSHKLKEIVCILKEKALHKVCN